MLDKQRGVAVGENGTIVRTETGGVVASEPGLEISRRQSVLSHYPNPVTGSVTILYSPSVYSTNPSRVQVFDLLGHLAGEAEYLGSSGDSQQFRLDVSSLAAGVYYYGVAGRHEVKSIVVIK